MTIARASTTPRDALARLESMGFRKVATWSLVEETLECSIEPGFAGENVLYAFVADRQILYLGKTVRTLTQRMYGYRRPAPTQSTNIKGNRLILEAIGRGVVVEIFALVDTGLLYYGGFHINLAAGLEDSLVSELKPIWNKLGI